jgi:adenylylsulfate kinase-like enzyme
VSGYLFIEELVKEERTNRLRQFSQFYSKLLGEIKHNTGLLSRYEKPSNPSLMEEFQKYILQASVEAYSIKRRHEYLRKAFNYYLDPKTKGKIIGGK